MDCDRCQELIVDYEHGELEAATDAAVFTHMQSCSRCAQTARAERELTDSMRSAFGPDRELPMAVVAGVRQAMRPAPAPSLAERWRAALRPAIAAPAAAAVVLVVAIVQLSQPRLQEPAFSTTYFVRNHVAQTMGGPSSDRAWSAYLLTSANAELERNNSGSPNT